MFVRVLFFAICTWTVRAASKEVLEPEVSASHTFRRDYTFDPELGGWLKYHPMPVEWQDAALRCHYEGAILASPLDDALTTALSKIVMNRGTTTTNIFTGLSNANARSDYQSMEGVPIANLWLSWAADPKVKPSEENCLVMNIVGKVSAVRCSDPHPFVCYRQKPFSHPNKCGTEDPDYVYNHQTGSCYKIAKDEKLTWSDAFQSCAIDGGYLAVINSNTEAKILWGLSRIYSRESTVFIGVRAWGSRRAWITVQGQSLEQAGYSEWRRGEPNNANGNEYCVGIYPGDTIDGVMNDIPCHDRHHYICEIEPKPFEKKEIDSDSNEKSEIASSSKLAKKLFK